MKNKFFVFTIAGIIFLLMIILNCIWYINITDKSIPAETEKTVFNTLNKEKTFVNILKEEQQKEDIIVKENSEEITYEESVLEDENFLSDETIDSVSIDNVDNSFTTENNSSINYTPSQSGLTQQGGVNYYDGRTETYYSSNVLYHYRTPEWTLDNEGFYRTDEGYYVVAASDMPQSTVFEGSKGTCIVLDSGCNTGVTDYYVGW